MDNKRASVSTMADEAATFLMYQCDVEVASHKNLAAAAEYVVHVARALADKKYKNPSNYLDFLK